MVCHALQGNWEHLRHDLLVAVVKHLEPLDAKAMHRVCLSWHLAVRCGLQSMKPTPKLTPFYDVRDYFPRVSLCARCILGGPSILLPTSRWSTPHALSSQPPPVRSPAIQHAALCPPVSAGANAASTLAGSAAEC